MTSRSFGFFVGTVLAFSLGFVPVTEAQSRQAFRVSELKIVDPHIFLDPFGTGSCIDITNPPGLLNVNVNGLVADFIGECTPVDQGSAEPCTSDFNLVAIFDPLDQTPGEGGALQECTFGGNPCLFNIGLVESCTHADGAISCDGSIANEAITTFSSAGAGTMCLAAHPGTTGPGNAGNYTPGVVATDGPCGVSGELDLTLNLGSNPVITIPLEGMELAAQYVGDPATGLINGLARGFLSESAADGILIEITDPITLAFSLTQVLPGADKCVGGLNHGQTCSNAAQCPPDPSLPAPTCTNNVCVGGANAGRTCANAGQCLATRCQISCAPAGPGSAQDDRDLGPSGELGWWFYLSFQAEAVGVPEPPTPTATPTSAVPPTNTPTPVPPTPTPTNTATPQPPCPGDCNGNRIVTIAEVQSAANIFLGTTNVSACPAADVNSNGTVTIGEVTQAASSFRLGCP